MDPIWIATIGIAALFLLILLEVPIGVAMGMTGIAGFAMLTHWQPALTLASTEVIDAFTNNSLVTIPLFLLMGGFAATADLSSDLFRLANAILGHRRGGLAMTTVLGCAGFGSVCGSSLATVGTFSGIALPEMRKRGYSPELSAGTVAAAGTLGILVPPSVIMVIYASLADVFIVDLFAAAIIPSVVAIGLQLLAIRLYLAWKPEAGPAGPRMPWVERLREIGRGWLVFALALVIFASIYGGIFTVNEAASLGAILCFAVAVFRRRLGLRGVFAVLREAAINTAMIFTIIVGALIFAYFISVSQMPQEIVAFVKGTCLPPVGTVTVLLLMFLVLGAVFDETAAMMLTMPFVLPLIVDMGYDPIWWGIINVTVIELGMIIPPIGMNVFMLHAMNPEYRLGTIYHGVMPFIGADLARLAILTAFPVLTLYLPAMLR